jgi:hypothetical protein
MLTVFTGPGNYRSIDMLIGANGWTFNFTGSHLMPGHIYIGRAPVGYNSTEKD